MASQATILLVTDDSELLDALGTVLKRAGYRVLPAVSGDRAVDLLLDQLPDLVVLDMLLPGQSGFQLTQLLKERSNGAVPVIMMSDHPAPAHRDYAFAAGVDWFLEKWRAPAWLLQAVEMLCPLSVEAYPPVATPNARVAATTT
jgi:DNA-binding response OmpR family regulator